MRNSLRLLLASLTTVGSGKVLTPAPLALLPPLPLYRRLLRIHRRKLPREERLVGDEYVKAEFRKHQDVESPIHIIGFLTEWQMYAQTIEGDSWQGATLDRGKIDKMSDDQINQLYDLMQAIKNKDDTG